MASKQQKTTYTAAEVAVLEETILKQKAEIDELKRKLEQFNPERLNAVWRSDITYIWTKAGFVYLTSIMDLYSRKSLHGHFWKQWKYSALLIQ